MKGMVLGIASLVCLAIFALAAGIGRENGVTKHDYNPIRSSPNFIASDDPIGIGILVVIRYPKDAKADVYYGNFFVSNPGTMLSNGNRVVQYYFPREYVSSGVTTYAKARSLGYIATFVGFGGGVQVDMTGDKPVYKTGDVEAAMDLLRLWKFFGDKAPQNYTITVDLPASVEPR